MKTATNFQEKTISRHAKNVGLRLEKGYQQYLHQGWGYVEDEHGNRIEGYQLFDCAKGLYHSASYNDIHTHCLSSIDDVKKVIAETAQEKGIIWY